MLAARGSIRLGLLARAGPSRSPCDTARPTCEGVPPSRTPFFSRSGPRRRGDRYGAGYMRGRSPLAHPPVLRAGLHAARATCEGVPPSRTPLFLAVRPSAAQARYSAGYMRGRSPLAHPPFSRGPALGGAGSIQRGLHARAFPPRAPPCFTSGFAGGGDRYGAGYMRGRSPLAHPFFSRSGPRRRRLDTARATCEGVPLAHPCCTRPFLRALRRVGVGSA